MPSSATSEKHACSSAAMADKPVRGRGRPRNDQPGSTATTWLRAEEHDRLIKLAQQHRVSVSQVMRVLLKKALR